jgi:GntR family transcriptional regulator
MRPAKTRMKKTVDTNCLAVTIQSNFKPLSHGMLHFQINPHSGVPVYRQMIDQVKYYVASDALKAGDQLPSIRELAQLLAINPTTVVRVYTELEREGVIEMRHGKGAFVTDSGRRMTAAERDKSLRLLARQLAVEATQMGAPASQVLKVVREELADLQDAEEVGGPLKVSVVRR